MFPKQAFLIDLLLAYGFKQTKTLENGEIMLAAWVRGIVAAVSLTWGDSGQGVLFSLS